VSTTFDLVTLVEQVITDLLPGQFLTLDYDSGDPGREPYAQLAIEFDEYYLEVVSEHYLPPTEWPLNTRWLRSHGWSCPDESTANWWRTTSDAHLAARALVTALTTARACREPDRFSVSIGTFSPPPGGGKPLLDTRDQMVAA